MSFWILWLSSRFFLHSVHLCLHCTLTIWNVHVPWYHQFHSIWQFCVHFLVSESLARLETDPVKFSNISVHMFYIFLKKWNWPLSYFAAGRQMWYVLTYILVFVSKLRLNHYSFVWFKDSFNDEDILQWHETEKIALARRQSGKSKRPSISRSQIYLNCIVTHIHIFW